jgi:hypothetical protein
VGADGAMLEKNKLHFNYFEQVAIMYATTGAPQQETGPFMAPEQGCWARLFIYFLRCTVRKHFKQQALSLY